MDALLSVRVRSASAGAAHNLVVTEEGALYSFGSCEVGQLGHGDHKILQSPKMVNALRNVRIAAAAAGGFHSLALAKDATVFWWGRQPQRPIGHWTRTSCSAMGTI